FDSRVAGTLTNTFTRQPATRFEALTTPFSLEPRGDLKAMLPEGVPLTDAQLNAFTLAFARALFDSTLLGTLGQSVEPDAQRRRYTLQGGSDGELPNAP